MPVSATDLKALSRLLDEALALAPGARPAWLAALPPPDIHFRGQLERMLSTTGTSDEDLSLPALGMRGAEATAQGTECSGAQVGPYRLVRRIGTGGMGAVWLAHRADGTMHRDVALKLPHVAWSPALNARLAREREILERLTHPNIARLYDAGVDEQGRPFLAMEYVEGLPVDEYAKKNSVPIRDRLTLFLQIAGAVAYAHARLIVHRDLKP